MDSLCSLEDLIRRAEELYADLRLETVRRWKEVEPERRAIGCMPIYVPREIIHAAGMLPVGIMGGGDQLEIIRGDAYFQSYICHIPRSTVELGVSGRLDVLDGMLFPSICDVIRNLSGMWQLLFPGKLVRYLDVPQNFDPAIGGRFYRRELEALCADLAALGGTQIDAGSLRASIESYNRNRELAGELYAQRSRHPERVPTVEAYLLMRAGNVLPVEEHNEMLSSYLRLSAEREAPVFDNSRVILVGAFCEQPPLGLLRTLERAGCYIVGDDLVLGARWYNAPVDTAGDPLAALVDAYLEHSAATAAVYTPQAGKGDALVRAVRDHRADGVIFCAPSFCDPALLDQPMLAAALDREGIPHIAFRYSETSGQFQDIREQAGTFSDSIKLWAEA